MKKNGELMSLLYTIIYRIYSIDQWEVHGIWFGVRRLTSPLLVSLKKNTCDSNRRTTENMPPVLKDTLYIINVHFIHN